MRLLVLTNMYPKENELYRNAFIHRRVVQYIQKECDVKVFVMDKSKDRHFAYSFDGVNVIEGNKNFLLNYIQDYNPDKILIHFIDKDMMSTLEELKFAYPSIVWIHGVEALGWYRRLFNAYNVAFIKYALCNIRQMISLKKFIEKTKNENVTFVFVSEWMKRITETDTLTKINQYEVIPNVVDTRVFQFEEKDEDLRKKVLLIRPFESRKYANDLAIKAIVELSKREVFKDMEFTIYGKGRLFDQLIQPLLNFENVHVYNKYLTHSEIANEHKKNGVFLCPTRQDSQGVSMCEAMASGLVPITSDNTAIPEFVTNRVTGFTTKNYKEIADSIEHLYNNADVFSKMSKATAESVINKCNPVDVINKELNLIMSK
ncbi:glycosyltransferase family 4 protein [Bacillus sp. BP-3]|uniref:glycosyltransferase family 4 protein n=1 Tax=Bacillus sp. BP-3 TaxID=3022773 RepID=UPI002330D794|nr:glycosyltransferase family 4 protein [Bacillus sp. BP-3]MDC2866203.1 glycosyltransferase family 4 protein [Bacillus sp. BP-3]